MERRGRTQQPSRLVAVWERHLQGVGGQKERCLQKLRLEPSRLAAVEEQQQQRQRPPLQVLEVLGAPPALLEGWEPPAMPPAGLAVPRRQTCRV